MSASSHSLVCGALLLLSTLGCASHQSAVSPAASEPMPATTQAAPSPSRILSQAFLRADLRQLAHLLDQTHPDPYTRAGGRVAFYRLLDSLLRSIPPEGMSVEQFFHHIRPLVAALKDGHTTVRLTGSEAASSDKLALEFEPVDELLYVQRVHATALRPLLGATLAEVEGVPFEQLSARMERMIGADNRYQNLINLTKVLRSPADLAQLLERPELKLPVRFTLRQPDGKLVPAQVQLESATPGELAEPPTQLSLPPPNSADLAWSFLTPDGSVAYLRIDSMMRYREAFEVWRATGYTRGLTDRLDAAARAAGHPELPTVDERIAAVPSATELFRELFSAMRSRHTRTLLVDLRANSGGNSMLANILGYFLFPVDTLVARQGGYQVIRYSALYFESRKTDSLEHVNQRSELPLELGDLDFSSERRWRTRKGHPLSAEELAEQRADFLESAGQAPTFAEEVRNGDFNAAWQPQIVVLTSARTYSAGFDLTALLYSQGATLVGVPSSQAGNCFIDVTSYRLEHSGLTGSISFKYSLLFPEDAVAGELLRPQHELHYEQLAAMGFDPNAVVRLALQQLGK